MVQILRISMKTALRCTKCAGEVKVLSPTVMGCDCLKTQLGDIPGLPENWKEPAGEDLDNLKKGACRKCFAVVEMKTDNVFECKCTSRIMGERWPDYW
jgi:hypothetical protein